MVKLSRTSRTLGGLGCLSAAAGAVGVGLTFSVVGAGLAAAAAFFKAGRAAGLAADLTGDAGAA
jgi:hypothetical protein